MFTLKNTVANLLAASALLASSSAFAQYSEVKRLGTAEAVCLGGTKTVEQFQAWTAANKATVNALLSQTVLSGVEDKILTAIATGDLVETQYAPGSTFEFMSSKKKGVPTILPNKIWAGSKSFEGYQIIVSDLQNKYTVVIPKACCNFSLASVESVATTGADAGVEDSISASSAKSVIPFVALFGGSERAHRYEAAWGMDKKDTSGLKGARIGAKLKTGEGVYLVPSLGYVNRTSINKHNTYPESSIHVDLGIEKAINSKMFVGAGVGLWNASKSSLSLRDPSVFVNLGGVLSDNLEWFTEARVIDDPKYPESAFGAGVRLTF